MSLSAGTVFTAEQRKNSKPELYNRFLFCNSFLPFRRYLHNRGHEYMFFRQEDMKTCFLRRVCLAYLILEWNLSQSYKKSEITTTFKQETCRNLAFLLRLRQVWFRKTVPNVLVKQRADYKLPKYRYCIKRETVITLPTEIQRVIMFNKHVVTE